MKKLFLLTIASVFFAPFLTAQNSENVPPRRSDRKILELKKIISLTPKQESTLRVAYELNAKQGDTILYQVQDATEAAIRKYDSDKQLRQTLMNTLNESQRNQYIRVTSTPEVQAKAAAKVEVLKENGTYTTQQLDSAQVQIFEYLMLEKMVYTRDKYDYRKQKENIRQLKKRQPTGLRRAETQEKAKIERKHYQGRTEW